MPLSWIGDADEGEAGPADVVEQIIFHEGRISLLEGLVVVKISLVITSGRVGSSTLLGLADGLEKIANTSDERLLIGAAARHRHEFSLAHAVQLVPAFARAVEHNVKFAEELMSLARSPQMQNSDSLAVLLRN